jgi:hypothetical protein
VTKVGIEGTGAYGVGVARFLRRRGIEVVEVNRPNRQARRNHGKSDPLDAVEAARAALSGRASGAGKTKDGPVEAIRVLVVAKRSARGARIKAITQIRHLGFTAPEQLHCRLKGLTVTEFVAEGAKLRPVRSGGCRKPHPVAPTRDDARQGRWPNPSRVHHKRSGQLRRDEFHLLPPIEKRTWIRRERTVRQFQPLEIRGKSANGRANFLPGEMGPQAEVNAMSE